MNERIAKLYDQALVLESNGDYVAGELDPVKFAELIVRECMRMCEVAEVGLLTHGLKEQSYGAVGAKQHISNWFEVDK
jgi:hypothetical protein